MARRLALLAALTVAAGTATLAGAAPNHVPSGTIWVTERTPGGLSTVAAIDAATGAPRGITLVGDAPIGITQPNGTNKVYSSDEAADQLSVIDRDTVTVIGTIDMGSPSGPHHLMASTNGHYIYVGEYHHNMVGVVDTRLDENVVDYQASNVAGAHTHAVWITPGGKDLYATNEGPVQTGPGTFSKLDARTGELIWEHGVGNARARCWSTTTSPTSRCASTTSFASTTWVAQCRSSSVRRRRTPPPTRSRSRTTAGR